MPNIIDYIKWRGDLSLSSAPFCEVDNLILSYLAYVNLDGIAPACQMGAITVKETSDLFFDAYTPNDLKKDLSFIRLAPEVLKAMAKSARFQNAIIQNYTNTIEPEKELQFAALEIVLEDETSYIAFRGTDDTIVGWKEDFHLSNGLVPSQKAAAEYMNLCGGANRRALRVGGHSKGGNLAIYGAAFCNTEVKERIIAVYDNDGPGFLKEFVKAEEIESIRDRIHRFIPESSVIGMLFEHLAVPQFVASSQKGIMQHDGLSWQVMGPKFKKEKALNPKAVLLDETLRQWIDEMNVEDRTMVINDFFAVLEATQVKTLTELQTGGLRNVKTILGKLDEVQPETKETVENLIKSLSGNWFEALFKMDSKQKTLESKEK